MHQDIEGLHTKVDRILYAILGGLGATILTLLGLFYIMDKRNKTDTIIVIHCTQTPADMDVDVAKVTEWHTQRGFDTIGYHYLIKRDGTLQTGRDEDLVGAHAVAVNGTSIGIALVGGGTVDMGWEDNFTPEQFNTLKSIILKN